MAILEHELRSAGGSTVSGMQRLLFTRDEYYTMALAGVFGDRRIELIEGEIIEMPPIGPFHAAVNHPLAAILGMAFGPGFTVRNQVPIALGESSKPSDPQPDIAVATGAWRDYVVRNPGPHEIRLVVEVADSSLKYDRTIKGALYASAGIPEYWILNLVDRQLEVYRDPSGSQYASVTTLHSGDSVEPLFAPGKPIAISDFLP